jgi:hypothetical protein
VTKSTASPKSQSLTLRHYDTSFMTHARRVIRSTLSKVWTSDRGADPMSRILCRDDSRIVDATIVDVYTIAMYSLTVTCERVY